MPEGVYLRDYNFICRKCNYTFTYHKLDKCPRCGSFGVRINKKNKNKEEIKMEIDIKKIEAAYKRKYELKNINKKTKRWKAFYREYRSEKLAESNIPVKATPKYKKGQKWNKPKSTLMVQFEQQTKKNAIRAGKITGNFEYWLWMKAKKQARKKL